MKVPILATRAAERSQPSAAVRNPAGKYHSSKSREGRVGFSPRTYVENSGLYAALLWTISANCSPLTAVEFVS